MIELLFGELKSLELTLLLHKDAFNHSWPWSVVARISKTGSKGPTQIPAFGHYDVQILAFQLNDLLSGVVSANDEQLMIWYLGTATIKHPEKQKKCIFSVTFLIHHFTLSPFQISHLTGRSGPISHCVLPIGRNVLELPDPLGIATKKHSNKSSPPPSPSKEPTSKTNPEVCANFQPGRASKNKSAPR